MVAETEQDQLVKQARPHLFMDSALATRLLDNSSVIASPVLIEIINNLTFAEFYEIYAKAKRDSRIALDNSELVEFLLAGNADGKKLVVASFSGGGSIGREGITAETALKLASLSRAHKIALLSNVRLDWYGLLNRDTVRTELLAPTMLSGEHDEKLALLRNPRMDRRFVADVIRGKDEFHAIPARDRFFYGLEAIKVKEIEYPYYSGKDHPDANEMYFHNPERALLATLREVLADTSIELSPFYLEEITRFYGETRASVEMLWATGGSAATPQLQIEDEDWLSDDQKRDAKRDAERISDWDVSDWVARYEAKHRMALINFINWVASWSVNEPEILTSTDKTYAYGTDKETRAFEQKCAKGTLAAMLSLQAFSTLDDNKEIKKGMRSQNWCVRAGAFAVKYASLRSRYVARWMFVMRYAWGHPYVLIRGLALLPTFWERMTENVTYGFKSFLGKYHIKINDATRYYLLGHVREIVYPESIRNRFAEMVSTKSGVNIAGVDIDYLGRVLINIFYVAVVLYVFDKLQGRSEAIIVVAVLGLIYVTIRSIAISQGMGLANALKVVEADLIRLRELVGDRQARHRLEASKAGFEVLSRERNKLVIDGFFLFIVSIICLLALFGELGR